MIRLATQEDMPELLRMGELFFNASGYAEMTAINLSDTEVLLDKLIEAGTLLTDGKGGMIGFVIFPLFMNASYFVAQELFWWVDEDQRKSGLGIELLSKAEELSKEYGANQMIMLSLKKLDGDRVSKLYKSRGYQERENTFMRAL